MRLRSMTAASAVIVTILSTSPLSAQGSGPAAFTGTWVLSIDDSDFGMSPPPEAVFMKIAM